MTGQELIDIIKKNKCENKEIRCSVAFDNSEYPFLRAYGENIEEVIINLPFDIPLIFTGKLNDDYTKDK